MGEYIGASEHSSCSLMHTWQNVDKKNTKTMASPSERCMKNAYRGTKHLATSVISMQERYSDTVTDIYYISLVFWLTAVLL